MSELDKLTAILRMADPERNSSYRERKNALNIAHSMMDKAGVSYASLGFSQSEAERIENQFAVTSSTNPIKPEKSAKISIFSQSGDITTQTPYYTRQPPRQQVKPITTSWTEENERKQRENFDRGYEAWEDWRKNEDMKNYKIEQAAKKFTKIAYLMFVLGIIVFFAYLYAK